MSSRQDRREGGDRDGDGSRRRERDRDRDRDRQRDRGRNKHKERKSTWDPADDDKKPRGDDGQRRERSRSGDRERHRERRRSKDRGIGRRGERGQDREKNRERERSPRRNIDEKEKPRGYRNRSPLPDQHASFKNQQGPSRPGDDGPPKEKHKPNFNNTGLLAAASNTLNSVVLKYTEPVDSRLPPAHTRWQLFTFKDGEIVGSPLNLNTQPAWLIGRDRLVADIPVDHPSCSKQHAVIQFRNVVKKNEEGGVRPYIVDLESANGTFLNKIKLEDRRFVEIRRGDMLKFGESTREYILMMDDGLAA